MLGLLPLYFIGKYYYELAHSYNRSRWGYAFLGVGVTLASQIVLGFIIGVIAVGTDNYSLLENELLINLSAIAFSILTATVVYRILKSNWEKKPKTDQGREDLLDN